MLGSPGVVSASRKLIGAKWQISTPAGSRPYFAKYDRFSQAFCDRDDESFRIDTQATDKKASLGPAGCWDLIPTRM
jgi:hypothetical protein